MKKLTLADIAFPAVYEEQRAEFRRRIIAMKRDRRVLVGDRIALVFENRETMRFQIQEMCRVEGITDQAGIQAEIEVYNALIPAAGELSATLLIEVTDSEEIRPVLDGFVGLDQGDRVFLEFAGERVPALFEAGHSEEDRISAVHYVRFPFSPEAQARFATCEAVALAIEHPGYTHRTPLAAGTLAALRADLAAEEG